MKFYGTVKLNLDQCGYLEKPKALAAEIRKRLCRAESIRDLTIDQLMDAIQRGCTFTPAAMTGTTGDTWKSQQVICADIDNKIPKLDADGNEVKDENGKKVYVMLDSPLLPDEALAVMERHRITPCFMYYSFSKTDAWLKYRIVLVLEQPLTNAEEAEDLRQRFTGIFNRERAKCADTGVADNARLFFGSRAHSVFYVSRQATSVDTLRALPDPPPDPDEPAKRVKKKQAADGNRQRAQSDYLRDAIETFDLAAHVGTTEDADEVWRGRNLFFNPCPMCGHNDCFQVTGHVWHCWSDNHTGINGGTIIDYLQARHKLTLGEAMSMFENQIIRPTANEDFASVEASEAVNTGDPDSAAQLPPESAGAAETGAQATTEAKNHRQKKGVGISSYILDVMPGEIDDFASMGAISTGFTYLDGKSGGGLFPGLYVVGAISGLGKTTLIHQMADQMAAGGHDVLFFSLEQSCLELATKSLARMTAKADPHNAITSLKIRRGVTSRPLSNAIRDYTQAVGDRLNIIHGGFKYTIEALRACVEQYIDEHDTRPVVILDYLQILNAEGKWPTRRDETDYLVSTLKIMSGELSVPVIAISSVNRSNYTMTIDFESLKESGGIEYTADVVWGLQYSCMTEKLFEEEKGVTKKRDRLREAKDENPRRIQLIPLKNRYGGTRWKVDFKYYPEYDWFEEFSGTALAERERIEAQEAQVRAKQAEEKRKELAQKAGEKRVLRSLAAMTQKEIMKMPDPPTETDFDPLS